ncbi:MAG: class B sortase [Lachnospiraceae bacterium]|nr:class B sortase [Lachnospiraceae bacterium]
MIWKRLLTLLFAAVFCFSALQFFSIQSEYQDGKDAYQAIERNVIVPMPSFSDREAEETGEKVPISVDFETLIQINPDVVGWIYSEGTPINYPILKGQDNEEYLHRMINRQENSSGSIFMDQFCDSEFSSLNTILYGHHMKNGTMFASICDYCKPGYYEEHPFFWILTSEKEFRVDVLAGMMVYSNDDLYVLCENRKDLEQILERAQKESVFQSDAWQKQEKISQVVTLSTCIYEQQDARFVLIGSMEENSLKK